MVLVLTDTMMHGEQWFKCSAKSLVLRNCRFVLTYPEYYARWILMVQTKWKEALHSLWYIYDCHGTYALVSAKT